MKTGLVAVFFTLVPVLAVAGENRTVVVARSNNVATLDVSTADECMPTFVDRYTKHAIHKTVSRPSEKVLLITQQIEVGEGCHEGFSPASVSANANIIDLASGRVGSEAVWSFSTEGVSGEVDEQFRLLYKVRFPTCCGSEETIKYFSLDTGQQIASTTTRLLEVSGGRSISQTFYLSAEGSLSGSPIKNKRSIASIFVGDQSALKDEILVIDSTPTGKEDWWISEFSFDGDDSERSRIAIEKSGAARLVVELSCQCDAEPLKLNFPIGLTSVDDMPTTTPVREGISIVRVKR